jgi:hypothetical protein
MNKEIDYRSLLIKYMTHVGYHEGIYFVGTYLDNSTKFTEEEKEELRILSEEAE